MTQEFFTRLLRLNSLASVAPHKGKFRTFLLASSNHFLADAWDAATAAKRGGNTPFVSLDEEGAEERYQLQPASDPTPDMTFERRWVPVSTTNLVSEPQSTIWTQVPVPYQTNATTISLTETAPAGRKFCRLRRS